MEPVPLMSPALAGGFINSSTRKPLPRAASANDWYVRIPALRLKAGQLCDAIHTPGLCTGQGEARQQGSHPPLLRFPLSRILPWLSGSSREHSFNNSLE